MREVPLYLINSIQGKAQTTIPGLLGKSVVANRSIRPMGYHRDPGHT